MVTLRRGPTELGFLAPTNVGEKWLGEAETERGTTRGPALLFNVLGR